jgi:hypothetical protein
MASVAYQATLGDMQIDGDTPAQAKQRLIDHAAAALTGDYQPSVLHVGDRIAFIFRTINGTDSSWAYKLYDPHLPMREGIERIYGDRGHATAADAENAARFHMAQNAFDVTDPLTALAIVAGHRQGGELRQLGRLPDPLQGARRRWVRRPVARDRIGPRPLA